MCLCRLRRREGLHLVWANISVRQRSGFNIRAAFLSYFEWGASMKQVFLFIALTLIAVSARADVFKCQTANGVVYSEQPCAKGAKPVNSGAKRSAAPSALLDWQPGGRYRGTTQIRKRA